MSKQKEKLKCSIIIKILVHCKHNICVYYPKAGFGSPTLESLKYIN